MRGWGGCRGYRFTRLERATILEDIFGCKTGWTLSKRPFSSPNCSASRAKAPPMRSYSRHGHTSLLDSSQLRTRYLRWRNGCFVTVRNPLQISQASIMITIDSETGTHLVRCYVHLGQHWQNTITLCTIRQSSMFANTGLSTLRQILNRRRATRRRNYP